jgi:coenzyme Q-binding protein COQ10
MPSFRTTLLVGHTPTQMFDLVADVERYPEFLPFCESLIVKRRTTSAEEIETIHADMAVGYKAVHEKFTSKVTLNRPLQKVLVEYIDGPFSFLENRWAFIEEEGGCRIEFYINYEFRNRLLAMLAGAMFDRIFRSFTQAFKARADALYGHKAARMAKTDGSIRT